MMSASGYDIATAFMLLFSLQKYGRWVSSLKSTRPLSATAASKELQRLAELKSQFPALSGKITTVLALHLELMGCLAPGRGHYKGLALQWPRFLNLATRQGEAVARLSACCEKLTLAGAKVGRREIHSGRAPDKGSLHRPISSSSP